MNEERTNNKGFILRVILTVIICIAAFCGGAIFGIDLTEDSKRIAGFIALGILLLALVIIALNALFAFLYKKSKSLSVREGRQYICNRMEEAESNLKEPQEK